ncbi:MAG: hypothetical protein NTY88_11290, partial [Bacteroidetes bacterium]|nr:hypothetical protein [Bacteroidota bacterium]
MNFSAAHVINPVSADENEELFTTQQITVQSMLAAKKYFELPNNIRLCSIAKKEIVAKCHPDFFVLPNLQRDISDVLPGQRKSLPFLKDILQAAGNHTSEDYIIYTNLDIALMPYFYSTIATYVAQGHDAIIINRRLLHNKFASQKNLNMLYAEAGRVHTGYDCFVMKRSLLSKFILNDICLGAPPVCNDLFYNIFTFAENPILLTDKHLTFHIGFELYKDWGSSAIVKHNYSEFYRMIKELFPHMNISKFPGADLSLIKRHFKWLMNPTFHYPTMLKLDAK